MTTKIPVELSSTPGIVDGSNATAITIDSSENVGIGTGTISNESDHKKLKISGASGTGAGIIEFADGSNNIDGAIFSDDGNLFIVADRDNATADSSIRFRVDGSSEKMRIDSSGNTTFTTGTNDSVKITGAENSAYIDSSKIADVATKGIFIALSRPEDGNVTVNGIGTYDASGKNNLAITSRSDIVFAGNDGEMGRFLLAGGLTFNGDTAAANALDDYEEGNFTPTFVATGGTAPSGQTGTGQYTKIGDVVYITGQITWTGAGSGGSNMYIALPFAVISDARAGMAIGLNSGVQHTANHQLHLVPELNNSVMYVIETQPDSAGHTHLSYGNVVTSASDIFSFSGCYHTSA